MCEGSFKTRRRAWLAAALSAVLPGLGHIYCGQIVVGIMLMFVASFFCPVLVFDTYRVRPTSNGIEYGLLLMFGIMTVLVGIVAIVDSWRQARRTRPDYKLKDYNRWYVYWALIVIFCGGAFGYSMQIRDKYIQAFRVPSNSMAPTIRSGDRLLAGKMAYRVSDPERGDVVCFVNPERRWENYVKRVVALAGDTVEIKDGRLYVNDQALPTRPVGPVALGTRNGPVEGVVSVESNGGREYTILEMAENVDFTRMTVPPYTCFVLGDNRGQSHDSRQFGPIPLTSLKGRFDFLYFPAGDWSRLGRVR